jgi:hypothetical protein
VLYSDALAMLLEHLYWEALHQACHQGLLGPACWLVGGYFTRPPPWASSNVLPSLVACGRPPPVAASSITMVQYIVYQIGGNDDL